MITVDLTRKELNLFLEFLEQYSEDLSNHGCNDMFYPKSWSEKDQVALGERIKETLGDDDYDADFCPQDLDVFVLDFFREKMRLAKVHG